MAIATTEFEFRALAGTEGCIALLGLDNEKCEE